MHLVFHAYSAQEYKEGSASILELIYIHRPTIVVVVSKKVLNNNLIRLHFRRNERSIYGFNHSPDLIFRASPLLYGRRKED
jgi:hypothetical protein